MPSGPLKKKKVQANQPKIATPDRPSKKFKAASHFPTPAFAVSDLYTGLSPTPPFSFLELFCIIDLHCLFFLSSAVLGLFAHFLSRRGLPSVAFLFGLTFLLSSRSSPGPLVSPHSNRLAHIVRGKLLHACFSNLHPHPAPSRPPRGDSIPSACLLSALGYSTFKPVTPFESYIGRR